MNPYPGMQMLNCSCYTWSSSDACEKHPQFEHSSPCPKGYLGQTKTHN